MKSKGLHLPGYDIGPILRRVRDRALYRATRLADGESVVVETLDVEYPSRLQIAEMQREYEIAEKLQSVDAVLRVHEMRRHGSGNIALITEPFAASVTEHLTERPGNRLPLPQTLDLAIFLVEALGDIHACEIVHKSITPDHVRLDIATGTYRLAGFSIASELARERQVTPTERGVEGSLPYISPEQTGRMNRDLDYRSDYYSLGVTLFELLTGQRPFEAETVLEWVHAHISREPPDPCALVPEIPEVVGRIVQKLLAKNPEDRYQSAKGLLADLRRCVRALADDEPLETFELGQQDLLQRFLVPQELYGRERELNQLLSLFEATVTGQTTFCLVHGYSGVGKSALVNELDRPLVRERGFLVQGKFDQLSRGEAYGALAVAFRGLVQQVLAEPEERLAQWRSALLDALAPNAQLMVDLVPELELIIGPQPSAAELPPAEARNRQQIVLTNFIRVFASAEHPLVLFLDDLQWSDIPTLDLLKRLSVTRELGHLLFIGAYRSNEVGPGHPLRLSIDALQASKALHDLALGPLDRESVARLVADALGGEAKRIRPLSDLLFDKAQGNPFFTTELLKKLHAEGVIRLDRTDGHWDWDLDAALWSGLSDDVVSFMIDNLRQLPQPTQQILQLAACIGGSFDLHTLTVIGDRSPAEIAAVLLPALRQHLVLPLNAEYRLVGRAAGANDEVDAVWNPSYRFLHDRVQQAAYALIDAQRMQSVHLSVGWLMLQNASADERDRRLIDIVAHLNAGRALIDTPEDRLRLAYLNRDAGGRARRSAAYEAALGYLKVGLELMPEDAWLSVPDLARSLALELQQCTYLTGRFDEADQWTEVLLERAPSDLERTQILATRTRQYATMGRMDASIQSAIQGLALLGMSLNLEPDAGALAEERRQIEANREGRPIASLADAPAVTDEALLLAMRLLMEIFPAAFLSGSGNLFPYLVLKSVNLSLRHGNCPESAFAYAAYGMLLCGELDDPAQGYAYGQLGLAINERLDDIALRARVIYVYSMFVHHWSNHWSSLTSWFVKGIEAGYQSGDLLYLAYSAQDCVIWDPALDLPTAERRHAENLEIVRECAYQDSLDSATLFLQLQRNLQGKTDTPESLSDADFDEQACLAGMHARRFMTGIANYHIYKAEACFMHEAYDAAFAHVCEQDRLIKSAMSLPQLVRFYIVSFLTRVVRYDQETESARSAILDRLQQDLAQMRRWAENCPENFLHLQCLMEAELARLTWQDRLALTRYDEAIEAARANGFMRDEAMACERAARFLISAGRRRAAEGYLRGAHRIYDRWGARHKAKLLEESFPVLRELIVKPLTESRLGLDDLDLASVMKASRAISGEMVIERLLPATMDILLENAGGQWGCLIVRESEGLRVAACGGHHPAADDDLPARTMLSDTAGAQVPLPLTLISHVLASDEPVVLNKAAMVGPFAADPYVRSRRPVSVLCVPIQREHFSGVVYMENNLASGVFTDGRVEVIRLLAAQAAVAIENARLYERVQEHSRTLEERVAERTARLEQLNRELQGLADRDGLTGVANRRRGDAYLQEAWISLRREHRPLSVILFDVDHFKAYNDNYGHQEGDDCLIAIARTIQAQMRRSGDLAVRYGGEEFMLILPDTDDRAACQIANHLRGAVTDLAVPHAFSSAGDVVSISVGVATAIPTPKAEAEHLVREADIALYRAKRMGRNQVQVSSGPCLNDRREGSV